MRLWHILLSVVIIPALYSMSAVAADVPPPTFGRLTPIPLHLGLNKVAKLTPEGRDGVITMAWRDNGNAHGFNVFTVMVHEAEAPPGEEWTVASFFDGDNETLTETDAPHTTEDYVRSIRFIRGATGTLAIIAARDIFGENGMVDKSAVAFTVFKLTRRPDNDPLGRPHHYFERVAAWVSEKRYCNSETALAVELGLPPPADWPGNKLPDGCP